MEALMIYLLKASGILMLFYLVYQVFLKKETFFLVNRHFLLIGVIAAFVCPFIIIETYVEIAAMPLAASNSLLANSSIEMSTFSFNWLDLIYTLYGIGISMLGLKFIFQLLAIRKVIRTNKTIKMDSYVYVEKDKDIAPFSFFRYIFYNPNKFNPLELEAILKHEHAHSTQKHSIDLLIAHLVTIVMWANPFSWLYKKNIEQNLEYLADETAIQNVPSDRAYKYALLKVSGNQFFTPITNNFYSSLIKKRIVMLHKSKSHKRNLFKMALILPALAIFLLSFNTKTIYVPKAETNAGAAFTTADDQKTFKILINKDTTNEELEELKKDLSDKGIDFSYTAVRNENKKIIELEIDMRSKSKDGKKFRGSSSFDNEGKPIDPITIVYDEDSNSFFMGDNKSKHKVIHKETDINTWVYSDSDEHKHIKIKIDGDEEIFIVNGKEVSPQVFEEMEEEGKFHGKHIRIEKKGTAGSNSNVFIVKDTDDENDIEIISEDSSSFFFIDTDDDEDQLYLIDGKESSKEEVKSLSPDEIETINVYKGDKAVEKYGEKAKDGVIEVKTKKGN
ncbi:M56 family metallopeptidase [uncultured Eudoraea sp.]|uniref:M56 family metallopeptidase n=1 Tax=uncultured Eudoraea sp. TaxID=1035614 RepID=UPI0026177254|nr:M56 family metallopeptidase [uncultured Eudoraea sp.]